MYHDLLNTTSAPSAPPALVDAQVVAPPMKSGARTTMTEQLENLGRQILPGRFCHYHRHILLNR